MKYQIVEDKKDPNKREDASSYVAEKPKWTLNEIALSSDTIEQIEQMVAYIQHRERILNDWEFNRFLKAGNGLSINFFGPPGTGKSITAEAIANKLGTDVIKANYGELESEYMGQTSKNISAIFKKAEETNSLLFFDEADAVLSRRLSTLYHAADHSVNMTKSVLLTSLDKFNGIVVFATNIFDSYDEAFLRRILFHVEFPMPDISMRVHLWRLHLSNNIHKDVTYERIAEISEGLAGGDIKNIVMKLGLKLLVNKMGVIDENMVQDEIEKYIAVKKRGSKYRVVEDHRNNT